MPAHIMILPPHKYHAAWLLQDGISPRAYGENDIVLNLFRSVYFDRVVPVWFKMGFKDVTDLEFVARIL